MIPYEKRKEDARAKEGVGACLRFIFFICMQFINRNKAKSDRAYGGDDCPQTGENPPMLDPRKAEKQGGEKNHPRESPAVKGMQETHSRAFR